jgi:hypothetical protein
LTLDLSQILVDLRLDRQPPPRLSRTRPLESEPTSPAGRAAHPAAAGHRTTISQWHGVYPDYETLREVATATWRTDCSDPEKIRSILATPYLERRKEVF